MLGPRAFSRSADGFATPARRHYAFWGVLALSALPLISAALLPAPAADVTAPPMEERQSSARIREGTEIKEVEGVFRMTGDRVTFFSEDGQRRYVALENLNLERIVARIADDPTPRQWRVTGLVTEFRGANYLLVRRALLKSRGQPSEDDFF